VAFAAAPAAPTSARGRADIPDAAAGLRERVGETVVGLDEVVEQVLIAILVEGHALLEGVPGLAKTLLVSTVARLLDLEFARIQFTPDLMPGDITGGEVLVQDASGRREFRFLKGPLFAHVVLADEINRTPPKTQAALMEAMEERHVTSLGVRRPLDRPFFVLATQNPIEQQGTYPLPIGQLDRFLVKIRRPASGRSASSRDRCSPTSCSPTRSTGHRPRRRPPCFRRCRSTRSPPPARPIGCPIPSSC